MLRVLCCGALICVVAGVSFAAENQYQKSILKSKSVDYIKKLNEVYHPAEIYDKKCAKLSTSDNEQILHMTDKLLNNIDKKDYNMIEKECEKILCNYSVYDVLTFLDSYIYDLSDTVNNNYFLALSELQDHYINIYKEGLE